MLLEVTTRDAENGESTTDRYTSVIPESFQLRRNLELTNEEISAGIHPHMLIFIGKHGFAKNAEQITVPLTDVTSFRLVAEKNETVSDIDMTMIINNEPAFSYRNVKIKRNNGLVYMASEHHVFLGVSYSEMTANDPFRIVHKKQGRKNYTATLELYNHDLLPDALNTVKEIRLFKKGE